MTCGTVATMTCSASISRTSATSPSQSVLKKLGDHTWPWVRSASLVAHWYSRLMTTSRTLLAPRATTSVSILPCLPSSLATLTRVLFGSALAKTRRAARSTSWGVRGLRNLASSPLGGRAIESFDLLESTGVRALDVIAVHSQVLVEPRCRLPVLVRFVRPPVLDLVGEMQKPNEGDRRVLDVEFRELRLKATDHQLQVERQASATLIGGEPERRAGQPECRAPPEPARRDRSLRWQGSGTLG